MKALPKEFILFDTEFTSWEGSLERNWSGPDEEMEIVQIGAIKVCDLEETNNLLLHVKPVINPVLSKYFMNLTGISQEIVDKTGLSYTDALEKLFDWSNGLPLYSYHEDGKIMKNNAELIDIAFPFSNERFYDITKHFEEYGIDTDTFSSGTIPEAFGVTAPPNAHNALNDARSILVALQALHN